MFIGKMVTNITGIVSRKGCMRLATETGTKMINRSRELGRNLTKADVEQIFEEVLPKSCRPKLITNREEIIPFLERIGYSKEVANALAYKEELGGMCIPNGSGKNPIWVPIPELGINPKDTTIATISHELEHALEGNNKPKNILGKKLFGLVDRLYKLFGKSIATDARILMGARTLEYQQKLQLKTGIMMSPWKIVYKEKEQIQNVVNNKELLDDVLKEYANATSKGSKNHKTFTMFMNILDTEIPAYTVGGRIEEKILGLTRKDLSISSVVAEVYKGAKKNIKQNRLEYWKNKLLCRLGRPTVYQSDKDLMRLTNNKEERQVLQSFVKDMNMQEKNDIFNVLKNPKMKVDVLIDLSKELSKDGKMIYSWKELAKLKSEILLDKEFMKYLKSVGEDGEVILPSWKFSYLNNLSKENFDALKKILDLADEADWSKYIELIPVMNSSKLDLLKKFIDEPKCTRNLAKSATLMQDMDYYLSREEIIEVTEKLRSTNDVNEVKNMIEKFIDLHDDSSQKLKDFVKTIKST